MFYLRLGKFFCTFLTLLLVFTDVFAAPVFSAPELSDYPAKIQTIKSPPLKLNKDEKIFRTRYKWLYKEKPNFAGHYGLAIVGCGTSCTFILAVDHATGKPWNISIRGGEELYLCETYSHEDDSDYEYLDPNGKVVNLDELEAYKYEFRANSRLLIATGNTEYYGTCSRFYYLENNGEFKLIQKVDLNRIRKSDKKPL